MKRERRDGAFKTFLSTFLATLVAGGCIFGVIKLKEYEESLPPAQEQPGETPGSDSPSDETPDDGSSDVGTSGTVDDSTNIPAKVELLNDFQGLLISPGASYLMPSEMAFWGPDLRETKDGFEPISTELTVRANKIGPNSIVKWGITFDNPDSKWATGKTATDYVTVTPTMTNGRTARVTCLAPFGERIKLVCWDEQDENVHEVCTVEFSTKVKNHTAAFGDVEFNFDGDTEVKMELARYADYKSGGEYLGETEYYPYTLKQYAKSIRREIVSPEGLTGQWNTTADGYCVLNGVDMRIAPIDTWHVSPNGEGTGISFGWNLMSKMFPVNSSAMSNSLIGSTYTDEERIELFENIEEGTLFRYVYAETFENKERGIVVKDKEFTTTFKLVGYTYNPPAE